MQGLAYPVSRAVQLSLKNLLQLALSYPINWLPVYNTLQAIQFTIGNFPPLISYYFTIILGAMTLKSLIFVSLLVGAVIVPLAEAQLGLVNGILGLIHIQGTVFCTLNGNIGVNGTATPVFPNAQVQLQCGAGNVVSTATTNGAGIFSILLDPLQFLTSTLLSNCSLVVNTPLASCNAQLPTVGRLLSPLQSIGNTLLGLLNIINIIPAGFRFIP